ncbi:MAG TPA: hypothetical protein VGG94_07130 [Chthoniobacterales bacterium]
MAALAFLIIGLACALIARVLLLVAAFRISVAWGLGVLLPFGPFFFRMNYPEEASRSRMLRIATLPCFFMYILLGPGPAYKRQILKTTKISLVPVGFSLEKKKTPAATPAPTPSLEERRANNIRQFEDLRVWAEALRLKKRDLLHSDTDGNIAYAAELAQYNAALEKAKAERTQLWPTAK